MPDPPSLADLERLAERALEHAEGEAQATARWVRRVAGERLTVEVTCVIDGRAAAAAARSVDSDGLRRAARAAAAHARRPRAWPSAGLPAPLPVAARDGFDPDALRPAESQVGPTVTVSTTVTREAILSTRGVRAAEQRSRAVASAGPLRRAATGAAGLPLAELSAEADVLQTGETSAPLRPGEVPVVLGPDAVAVVLDHLRPGFGVELDLGSGPLHGRLGTRVAAATVNLAEAPAHPRALPRAFDAEGVPRRPLPLIQDGVAHGRVHDTASAARAGERSTGHASRAAALAPVPEHLVLSGGGAATLAELCGPVDDGLYVAALSPAREADGDGFLHLATARRIVHGTLGGALAPVRVRVEPLALLGAVEALAGAAHAIPCGDGGAVCVVPALRAGGGLDVRR